jgi:thiamine-monophosphate kinase
MTATDKHIEEKNNSMTNRTEISTIGEFGLIERIKSNIVLQNMSSVLGIGDDAAILEYPEKQQILVSTDLLMERIHFDLTYTPLKHLGYKAVVVNVSDIAAMNGIAQQITIGLAISNRFSVEAIDELYEGVLAACKNYKVDLVGGDTTASVAGLGIAITVLGTAPQEKVVTRQKAKVGDVICVTGDLGAAYLGLQLLEREKKIFLENPNMQPLLEDKEYLVQRLLRPEARTDMIYEMQEAGVLPTSMIDISDGLASELLHICKSSGVGAVIYEEHIPIEDITKLTAIEWRLDPITCALNGGEDYELLFTIAPTDYEKIKHLDVSAIGIVREADKGVYLSSKQGTAYPIQAQGWVHLKK